MDSSKYLLILKIESTIFIIIYSLASIIDVFRSPFALVLIAAALLSLAYEVFEQKTTIYHSNLMRFFSVYGYFSLIGLLLFPLLFYNNKIVLSILLIITLLIGYPLDYLVLISRISLLIIFVPTIQYLYYQYIKTAQWEIHNLGYLAKDAERFNDSSNMNIYGMKELSKESKESSKNDV